MRTPSLSRHSTLHDVVKLLLFLSSHLTHDRICMYFNIIVLPLYIYRAFPLCCAPFRDLPSCILWQPSCCWLYLVSTWSTFTSYHIDLRNYLCSLMFMPRVLNHVQLNVLTVYETRCDKTILYIYLYWIIRIWFYNLVTLPPEESFTAYHTSTW